MEVLISDLNAIEGKGSNSPGGIIEGQISSFSLTSLKAMAPHSSTLAWKIPWMEETGRLLSMGSQRVRHVSNFTGSLVRLILRKIMLVRISFSLDKRGN